MKRIERETMDKLKLARPKIAKDIEKASELRGGVMFCEQKKINEIYKKHGPKRIGLGDTVARITKTIGIKPCAGCKKRQATLNKIFPYK